MQNWLLGGGLAIICTALGVLIRVAYKIGADSKEISLGLSEIREMKSDLKQVPILAVRIGGLEHTYQRLRSDFKELSRRVNGRSSIDPNEG